MAKKRNIELVLREANHGGGIITGFPIGAGEQYPYDGGVEDADRRRVAKEYGIAHVLERLMHQHRLIVGASVIEQDVEGAKLVDGECRPFHGLFDQIARMVRVEGVSAQNGRLDAAAGAVSHRVEHIAWDAHMASLDHKAREFDKELEKFVKHATSQHGTGPRAPQAFIGDHAVREKLTDPRAAGRAPTAPGSFGTAASKSES